MNTTDLEQQARHPRSVSRGGRPKGFAGMVAILLVLIAYGSVYPLAWDFDHPNPFILLGPVGRVDLIENIVLFVPLGCVLAWRHASARRPMAGFLWWFAVTLVFASVLQWLQVYLPRTPALSDIFFNMLGYVAGWALGQASAAFVARVVAQHLEVERLDRVALVMLVLWVVAELFPLIPALDVSNLWGNIKSLWQQDPWQPRRLLEHAGMTVIGLDALASLLRSVNGERHVRMAALAGALAVLAGKFIVMDQSPGLAVVAGIALGGIAWALIDLARVRRRAAWVLVVATLTYAIYAAAPYELSPMAMPMNWVPFNSSLEGGIHRVVPAVAFEALCFGAIVWSAACLGMSAGFITLMTALLAFAFEWLQQYLPGRTAEITSVFTALLMGWFVATATRRPARGRHGAAVPSHGQRERRRGASRRTSRGRAEAASDRSAGR